MNNLRVLGKFLDQPILVAKFQKVVPAILTTGAAIYTGYDASKAENGKKEKRFLKTGITMGVTVASALAAPYIASKIAKRELPQGLNQIKKNNKKLIDSFVKTVNSDNQVKEILEKSKNKILSFKEVKTLFDKFEKEENGKKFLEKLIPSPKNVSAKDIFSEIGYLSVYGAVPVVGGVIGGSISDIVTDRKNWKNMFPNKVKEGSYQYLANIFMCNVGAGAALAIMEKNGVVSKSARAIGMTLGIILTGVIGGSKIANFIGNNIIDRIFKKKEDIKKPDFDILDIDFTKRTAEDYLRMQTFCQTRTECAEENKERKPEVLDVGLHTDDIATVSLLSGLKWIEPALPIMYTISGYRAGIGYRN